MIFDKIVLFPFDGLRVSVFPKQCVSCGEIIDEDKDMCEKCEKLLVPIDPKRRCKFCGNDKDYCTCKSRVFYFKSVVSVYENDGAAKNAVYRYKLSKKSHYAEFLADKVIKSIETEFEGIKFGAVTSVPTAPHSVLTRGFDHSKLLAEIIAYKIGVKYVNNILKCRFFKKSQHKSKINERFANMRNKYYFSRNLNCKNVLLIDDIKTTGASLDACARQLLLAGAENVYCATVVTTVYKKSKLQCEIDDSIIKNSKR